MELCKFRSARWVLFINCSQSICFLFTLPGFGCGIMGTTGKDPAFHSLSLSYGKRQAAQPGAFCVCPSVSHPPKASPGGEVDRRSRDGGVQQRRRGVYPLRFPNVCAELHPSVSLRLTAPLKGSLWNSQKPEKPPLEGRWTGEAGTEECCRRAQSGSGVSSRSRNS